MACAVLYMGGCKLLHEIDSL